MDADVVVVGAGVMGSAIALELSRGGRSVIVVDKGGAVGGESTSASSAIIRFTYSTLAGVTASWEAMHQWADWAGHLGHAPGPLCGFHRVGMLHIGDPDQDLSPTIANFEMVGIPYEILDADALRSRFGAIDPGRFHPPRLPSDDAFFDDPDGDIEALYQPDAGFVDDPQLAAANLMDAARHHGADVRLRRRVTGVETAGGRVAGVTLDGGDTVSAPVVVNAAGPWSSQLNAIAGVTGDMAISTRAMRQEIAATPAPADFGVGSGGTVVGDMDLGMYFRPQPGGSLVIGGVEAACDPLEWTDDPDAGNPNPTPEMFEALALRTARRVPAVEIPHRPVGLASHYDVSDDWVPVYDRSNLDGFYLACGTSGNQFKNAPLVGEIVAAIVDGCEAGHDHDREPIHLACRHTGLDLDLGAFSRRRQPAETGQNVWG